MKNFLEESTLVLLVTSFFIVIASNMYYFGYSIETKYLIANNIPHFYRELKDSYDYMATGAIYVFPATVVILFIFILLQPFFNILIEYVFDFYNLGKKTFTNKLLLKTLASAFIIEVLIIGLGLSLKTLDSYESNVKLKEIKFKNKKNNATYENFSLVYQTSSWIFLNNNKSNELLMIDRGEIQSMKISKNKYHLKFSTEVPFKFIMYSDYENTLHFKFGVTNLKEIHDSTKDLKKKNNDSNISLE